MKLYSLYLLGWRVLLWTVETEKSTSSDTESNTERRDTYDYDDAPMGFVGAHAAHLRKIAGEINHG